ncbi:MAG: hypothetical protein OXU68_14215 [Bacteroidota bacterium]|nr:hypothetical protein [Bacteroidota bacterium]
MPKRTSLAAAGREPQPQAATQELARMMRGPGKKTIYANIHADLHKRFKAHCALREVSVSQRIRELLEQDLANPPA